MRRASRTWPRALLSLWAPVCSRSSRFKRDARSPAPLAEAAGRTSPAWDAPRRSAAGRRAPRGSARSRLHFANAFSSSASGAISVSGANRPPYSPKYPLRPPRRFTRRPPSTAAKKRSSLPRSLMPGALSTPEATSTPAGRRRRITAPTFSASSPPATSTGTGQLASSMRAGSRRFPVPSLGSKSTAWQRTSRSRRGTAKSLARLPRDRDDGHGRGRDLLLREPAGGAARGGGRARRDRARDRRGVLRGEDAHAQHAGRRRRGDLPRASRA